MKRMFLLLILATFVTLPSTVLAQGTNHRIAVSPAFATAQEAVDFANSQQDWAKLNALFTCEYSSGTPTESFYKVVYTARKWEMDLNNSGWHYKEFSSPKDVADFVNANLKTLFPTYTTCWNPARNPAQTTIVLFYFLTQLASMPEYRSYVFEIAAYGPFARAELAASWANQNVCDPHFANFLSHTSTPTQTEPTWYVITYENLNSCERLQEYHMVWHVSATAPNTETAINFVNQDHRIEIEDMSLASAFNTLDITGRIVLFVLEPAESEPIKSDDQGKETPPQEDTPKENVTENTLQNKPELIIPVRIFAAKTLLDKSASECLREITNTAVNSFHEQINFVRLETTTEIHEAPQIASSDPVILGNSLPYVSNTLAIFFTDQNLLIPETDNELERNISGRAGRSWVVVNVSVCDDCEIKPENVLLHEILHEFGVSYKQDPTSVMCSDLIIKSCPRNIITIDEKSLAEAKNAVNLIKKIGFDTHTRLVTR